MAESVENLVLEILHRLDKKVDGMAEDLRELRKAQSGILQILASHDGRLSRLEDRLERIEKRLDLFDPALLPK